MLDRQPLLTLTGTILEDFDLTDPANIGRSFYFNLDQFISTVLMLICSDEIENAMWLLDHPPAWHRDNYPKELSNIKKTLFKNLYDQYEYAHDPDEAGYTREGCREQYQHGYFYPRADILKKEILALNDNGQIPWLFELSPSHGAMVLGLIEDGCRFTFCGKNLNQPALDKLKSWLPDGIWQDTASGAQPKILISYESLEHMWREADLEAAAWKMGLEFDMIFLSTPYGTLGGGLPNWSNRRIGHVRAYTVMEFYNLASKYFPGYAWEIQKHASMVLVGKKI